MKSGAARLRHSGALRNIAALLFFLCLLGQQGVCQQRPLAARVEIDASKIEGRISPLLYGQFAEFMFEGVKGGITAELIRNRSFEEPPNAIGLSRYWERYPDDRDDDYALNFQWDAANAYPVKQATTGHPPEHSLRVDVDRGVIQSHGIFQSRIPVRSDVSYHSYLWAKAEAFDGQITVTLEPDVLGGAAYAAAEINNIAGEWRQYEFTRKPSTSDPLARLAILINGKGRLWIDQVSLAPTDALGG